MNDKLCYYSKSKDVPVGKGTHEYISNPEAYSSLNKIEHWRRILSNFYTEPFFFEKKSYNSIEHAFQSYKIALASPEKAHYFTLESNHPIGMAHGSIAQENRKIVILNEDQIQHWDTIKEDLMNRISAQRILQSALYKHTLFSTQNAELWHIVSRKGIVRNKYLEELRNLLR